MDMTGEYRIAAPREAVWRALNDPETLKACIPGAETLERRSDTEFEATVRAKIGPVQARFAGAVRLSNLDPPAGYTITGEGKGGAAGFAKGGADVSLADDGAGGTVLRYRAEVQVGGKLAQIGSRLVQGTAKKMADDFFGTFAQTLAPGAAPAEALAAPAAARKPFAIPPAWWIAGLIVAAILLLLVVSQR